MSHFVLSPPSAALPLSTRERPGLPISLAGAFAMDIISVPVSRLEPAVWHKNSV